ncbi:MAG TPA: hypothetical protein PKK70_03550 [Candidatus Paceibacterota bacterium]|nr:hypothetical protein [Candidatus Paceibacterota bacterium]
MTSQEIFDLIYKFDWHKLNKIYGCAHSSIIGFFCYEWLSISKDHSVLDGAPSPSIGKENGRKGQKNSDLLLCKNSKPFIPIEVETDVKKYQSKFESLVEYINNFESIEFGILYMTNLTNGVTKYKHNWHDLKKNVYGNKYPLVLISSEKNKINFESQNEWSNLLKRNDYAPWEIVNIDCYIYDTISCVEKNIWKK